MNPYKVLGIPEGADQETIKKAYRDLVKKYHPDQYANNPLSDLASEKMKEINEAYNMLTNGGGNTNYGGRSYQSGSSYGYADVRVLIQRARFDEAERLLNSKPANTAEWHYLKGIIFLNKGFFDKAITHLNTAVSMDPSNMEYRNARDNISNRTQSYRNASNPYNSASPCDFCSTLICADCCCECMGGDLISCC